MAYIILLLRMMMRSPIAKKIAVYMKAVEGPSSNHTLWENGMLTSMNTKEKKAVKVTVAIS